MVNYTGDQEAMGKANTEAAWLLKAAKTYADPTRGNNSQQAQDYVQQAYQMIQKARQSMPPSNQRFNPADMLLQLSNAMAQNPKQDFTQAIDAVLAQLPHQSG